ncbi:MAG: carboxylate-amine ligase [Pseudonocardiaceae bacterium]
MKSEIHTLGVEEEFHIHDKGSCQLTSKADLLVNDLPVESENGAIKYELSLSQVEISTPVCTTLAELSCNLYRLRRIGADRAALIDCALVPSGTPPLGDASEQTIVSGKRYGRLRECGQGLVREHLTAALHVHVGVPERAVAVAASNWIRPWLPTLTALTSNSPYWLGVDTGFSSWRTVHCWRWPVSGPPPVFDSDIEYDDLLRRLIDVGVIVDAGMAYWDVRLSARYPTLEIRLPDVPCRAAESVMVAGLVRALVILGSRIVLGGRPLAGVANEILRGSLFLAARDGLDAVLPNPLHPERSVSARDALEILVECVRPTLEDLGDDQLVIAKVKGILEEGTGASRQRRAAGAAGDLVGLVRWLAEEMISE